MVLVSIKLQENFISEVFCEKITTVLICQAFQHEELKPS